MVNLFKTSLFNTPIYNHPLCYRYSIDIDHEYDEYWYRYWYRPWKTHIGPFLDKTNFKSSHQFASPLSSFSSSPTHFQTNTQDKAVDGLPPVSHLGCGSWEQTLQCLQREREGVENKEREKRKEPERGKRCIDAKMELWSSKSSPPSLTFKRPQAFWSILFALP